MDFDPKCWACQERVAQPSRVTTIPGRGSVAVTLTCRSCGREWIVEHLSPSRIHTEKPSERPQANP